MLKKPNHGCDIIFKMEQCMWPDPTWPFASPTNVPTRHHENSRRQLWSSLSQSENKGGQSLSNWSVLSYLSSLFNQVYWRKGWKIKSIISYYFFQQITVLWNPLVISQWVLLWKDFYILFINISLIFEWAQNIRYLANALNIDQCNYIYFVFTTI